MYAAELTDDVNALQEHISEDVERIITSALDTAEEESFVCRTKSEV